MDLEIIFDHCIIHRKASVTRSGLVLDEIINIVNIVKSPSLSSRLSFAFCARNWVLNVPLFCFARKYDACNVDR
jgi:hypothetical protein